MRNKPLIGAIIFFAAIAVIFFGLSFRTKPISAGQTAVTTTQPAAASFVDPLTGMALATQPNYFVASVMLDNFATVQVRPGVESASIVYEALVEGGITRLMAVFDTSQQVTEFGPIRSVRPYFIDWASEYGGVLMHVGGSAEALSRLQNQDVVKNLDQIGAYEDYFTRDQSIDAPHNVFSSYSSWLKLGETFHLPPTLVQPWNYADAAVKPVASEHQQVEIAYSPTNHVGWVYNKDHANYLRFLNGNRQLMSSGDQLAAANVMLIEVPSKTIDTVGRQKMQTLGTGAALLFSNGSAVRGTWSKDAPISRMQFMDAAGEPMHFKTGTTWIEVVPSMDVAVTKTE